MAKKIISAIILVCMAIYSHALEFSNERAEAIYKHLDPNLQTQIKKQSPLSSLSLIEAPNYYKNAQLKITRSQSKTIDFIGLNLNLENQIDKKYKEAYLFMESYILTLFFNHNSIFDLEKKHIKLQYNNKDGLDQIKELKEFITKLSEYQFNLIVQPGEFTFSWISSKKNQLSISFPSNINLIKGMTKIELEEEFIHNLSAFQSKQPQKIPTSIYEKHIYTSKTELYIQKREAFETDNFRSDVYLTIKNNQYTPVFSDQYPIESLSNLFTTEISNNFMIQSNVVKYGNVNESIYKDFNSFHSFLSTGNKVFFGLEKEDKNTLKATIIYYNETYNYIHMLLVEVEKEILKMKPKTNMLTAKLYTYIPRQDLCDYNNTLK